jgi:superfamily II DNA/RNA helicase/cold shock CspA family protein
LSFSDLGVPRRLCQSLAERGIAEPFPIQTATLPDAFAGRDICGKAPTGSGKTIAFGLLIADRATRGEPRRPRALVLVPTRELAAQVQREVAALVGPKVGVVSVYGGVGYEPQRRALAKGAGVVVACPGRLEDLVARGDVDLGAIEVVVLDEADRMADMGFLPAVKRLLDRTPDTRQTLLFSATLDGDIDALTRRYQRDPARHEIAADPADGTEVAHHFWMVDRTKRVDVTASVAHHHGRTVVFCRTRHGADRLTKQLRAAGIEAVPIHGSRTQAQRDKAVSAFASGRVPVLVATDVAARGLHVDDVACVVHFDPPADAKDYVHRSGRTGRAGASGVVVSLVTSDQHKQVSALQKALGLPRAVDPAPASAPVPKPKPVPLTVEVPRAARPAPVERQPKKTAALTTPRRVARPRRPVGTVKFYDASRGYGFIARHDGGDLFVHVSNVEGGRDRPLVAGQRVQFEIGRGRRGAEARSVQEV